MFSGLLVIVFCERCVLRWLVFSFQLPFGWICVLYAKYNTLFSLSWQETFCMIEISKERQQSASTLCAFGNHLKCQCKTISVCLGGDRKRFLTLKRYSTTHVMLNTLVFWVIGATQVIFAACVRMLSPFPGYMIWKDCMLRTISYSPRCIF